MDDRMTATEMERLFQEAVQEAIAKHHAAGRPVFQEIDGYLVAIYPDGRIAKLKKLAVGQRP